MSQDANNVEMIDFNLKIKNNNDIFLYFSFLFFSICEIVSSTPRLEIRIAISILTLFFRVCRHYRHGFCDTVNIIILLLFTVLKIRMQ